MTNNFYKAIEERRSIFGINNEPVIPDERIIDIINYSVKNTPSAFNSQGSRVALLLNKYHTRFWSIALNELKEVMPSNKFALTHDKINGFSEGYGTILFFEDIDVVTELQSKYRKNSVNIPVWAQQSNGMLQYIIWTSLEIEGYGASIHHYSEYIDFTIKKEFNIPLSWKMIAEMPFGKPTTKPCKKYFKPIENRVLILKN